jgi:hypothetical protein
MPLDRDLEDKFSTALATLRAQYLQHRDIYRNHNEINALGNCTAIGESIPCYESIPPLGLSGG